jgi:hypothetical protein
MLVICALLFQPIGCTVRRTTMVTPEELKPQETSHIFGFTSKDGIQYEFDEDPPFEGKTRIVQNTLFGSVGGEIMSVPLDDVDRIWVKRVDTGASVMASLGLLAAITGGLLIIAIATKESCPFIYSWDGEQFVFDAEPYGGATTKGLERDDYSELESLIAENGVYSLLVTNEVNETQYTNFFELWAVDHSRDVRVAVDEWGNLSSLADLHPPSAAVDHTGRDLMPWLGATDRTIWEPPPVADESGNLRQDIILTFPRPGDAEEVKLVGNVATGLWGSHMIREMLELHGTNVDTWYAQLDENPANVDSLKSWNEREELFVLKVFVEEPEGWVQKGLLPGGGPFISEDRVLPLDIRNVQGDELRIRIRPPLGFWALNSFAVDYSRDRELTVHKLSPIEAHEDGWPGSDLRETLSWADDRYHVMPEVGDRAYVRFRAPPEGTDTQRTLFLHSRGYYRLHLTRSHPPDIVTLLRITTEPGAIAMLAAERYQDFLQTQSNPPQ